MGLVDRSWPVLRRMMDAHELVYLATGGLIGHRFPGFPPVLLLDHVGAKSGIRRTTPLAYIEDGGGVVLGGLKGRPPWYPVLFHNLRANPDTTVQIGSERRAVHARVA